MKAVVTGFSMGVAVVCVAAWLSGFDFDKRGEEATVTFGMALVFGLCFAVMGSALANLQSLTPGRKGGAK